MKNAVLPDDWAFKRMLADRHQPIMAWRVETPVLQCAGPGAPRHYLPVVGFEFPDGLTLVRTLPEKRPTYQSAVERAAELLTDPLPVAPDHDEVAAIAGGY